MNPKKFWLILQGTFAEFSEDNALRFRLLRKALKVYATVNKRLSVMRGFPGQSKSNYGANPVQPPSP